MPMHESHVPGARSLVFRAEQNAALEIAIDVLNVIDQRTNAELRGDQFERFQNNRICVDTIEATERGSLNVFRFRIAAIHFGQARSRGDQSAKQRDRMTNAFVLRHVVRALNECAKRLGDFEKCDHIAVHALSIAQNGSTSHARVALAALAMFGSVMVARLIKVGYVESCDIYRTGEVL
jgi:hypothetical protein